MRILTLILLSAFSASAAQNWVKNGSFEAGQLGWTCWANHEYAGNTNIWQKMFSTEQASDGDFSFKMPQYKAFYSTGVRLTMDPVWLPADDYYLTFKSRIESGSATLKGIIVWGMDSQVDTYNRSWALSSPGSWQSPSTTFTVTNDNWCSIVLYVDSGTPPPIYIDSVKISTVVSDPFTTLSPVEGGIQLVENYNLYSDDDTKELEYVWYNGSASEVTDKIMEYSVYDAWNSNVVSAFITNASIAAGAKETNTITLPDKYGWFRMVTRILGYTNSMDEATYGVVPYDARATADPTYQLMSTANWNSNVDAATVERGYSWNRIFGPSGRWVNWWSFIEPTEGNFTWDQADEAMAVWTNSSVKQCWTFSCQQLSSTNGLPILASWQTNGDLSWKVTSASNFVWNFLTRYPTIEAVEIWNEPSHSHGWWIAQPENYASLLTNCAAAVKAVDSGIEVVAMGGAIDTNWVAEVWSYVHADHKSNIDAISMHWYPEDSEEGRDLNADDLFQSYDYGPRNTWTLANAWGKDWWNTESGVWSGGNYRTAKNMWHYDELDLKTWSPEIQRVEATSRSIMNTERHLRQALRNYGWHAKVYTPYEDNTVQPQFYVDSAGSYGYPNTPYAHDLSDASYKAWAIAMSTMSAFLTGRVGETVITNVNDSIYGTHPAMNLEIYFFDVIGTSNVVTLASCDRNSYTLTVTNSYDVYDCFGNLMAGSTKAIPVSRVPIYCLTTTTSSNDVYQAFTHGTLSAAIADTVGPNVSVDIAPTANVATGVEYMFKWSAEDNKYRLTTADTDAIETRYKINNNAYSSWGQSSFVRGTATESILHFTVQARDTDLNVSSVTHWLEEQEAGATTVNSGVGVFNVRTNYWY